MLSSTIHLLGIYFADGTLRPRLGQGLACCDSASRGKE